MNINNKHAIKNRSGLNLVFLSENEQGKNGVAYILHGLGGTKDQPHIQALREAFIEHDFIVIAIDATNAFGESSGDILNATATNYISDLEDVISWSSKQSWYSEPFVIAGHSLGGISQLVYASRNLDKIRALAPLNTVISGKVWQESISKDFLQYWEQKGYFEKVSRSTPGKVGKVGFGLMKDMQQYDALAFVGKITCPVLLIAGSEEEAFTGPPAQKLLLEALGGRKELHVIEGMPHTPAKPVHLDEFKHVVSTWIDTI